VSVEVVLMKGSQCK